MQVQSHPSPVVEFLPHSFLADLRVSVEVHQAGARTSAGQKAEEFTGERAGWVREERQQTPWEIRFKSCNAGAVVDMGGPFDVTWAQWFGLTIGTFAICAMFILILGGHNKVFCPACLLDRFFGKKK